MFNIFIAESILKQVIETEGKKPEASRSYLYKLMRMKLMKKVDSLNKNSTPPLKAIDHVIAAIRKFSRIASRSTEADDYFYALNDKRMERCSGIKNRLLK